MKKSSNNYKDKSKQISNRESTEVYLMNSNNDAIMKLN
jgi:hypothetical protein